MHVAEQTPMLSRQAAQRDARLKRLPMAFVLIGIVLAPVLLFVGLSGGANMSSVDDTTTKMNQQQPVKVTSGLSNLAAGYTAETDLKAQCEEKFFTQTLDHFDVGAPTYEERYFVCDEHYREGGVMFFYVGNEADVELYLNHTGLMWENAAEFGAMMVFAEHRYFGKSLPFGEDMTKHMEYLSTEQTMADYAVLITYLKEQYARDIPVLGFGGSYGGMLGSWFRMKYPHIIDGVIAGSAPILSFLGDEVPLDVGSYARISTFDASAEAGAAPNCISNIRRVWTVMETLGKSSEGRKSLKTALQLCESTKVESEDDVAGIMDWAMGAFETMAMGNYPYPSSYIMSGVSTLPAYPVRAACEHVKDEYAVSADLELLHGFSQSLGVYYNSTHDQECFDLSPPSDESAQDDDFWGYIFCAEMYQPQSMDGVNDMFWSVPWNLTADNENCQAEWGIDAHPSWATIQYGGRKALETASNIVFSNGNFDPWSGTGVLTNYSDSVVALTVEGGAHHLDLMFSNELDTPSVLAVREAEKEYLHKWAREFYEHKAAVKAELS